MLGTENRITFTKAIPAGARIVSEITRLDTTATYNATQGGTAVTYVYSAADTAWYLYNRG